MKIEIKDNQVIITLPVDPGLPLSSTGKSRVIASTHGFVKTDTVFMGKNVAISVNVIVPTK